MDDRRRNVGAIERGFQGVVPETLAEAEDLVASIEREVQRHTGGAVRNLAVEVQENRIRLQGSCQSYYHKQLAQHAVMALPGGRVLLNEIEVV